MKCELVFYNNNNLLEGPIWDGKNKILYFVAIRDNQVLGLNTETKEIRTYPVGCAVGCAALLEDGNLIIAKKDGIHKLDVTNGHIAFICQPLQDDRMRFNDGKLDPNNRLLVGSMGDLTRMENAGGLYSVEGTKYRQIIGGTTVANGLGFSRDGQILYFIDTPTKCVMKYNYHLESGDVSNPRVAAHLTGPGSPDGMFVLPDDTLLVCEWGGGCISRWNPDTGIRMEEYQLPVTNITCCCLGGENMDKLYITTAKCKDRMEESLAGGLFCISMEGRG